MDLGTLLVLAVALSMDAFAVSICKGLAMKKITVRDCLIVGLWFGLFQGIMPFTGFMLGIQFEGFIDAFSSWIAFILLAFIGGNMVRESRSREEENETATLKFKEMFILAVATSIDALAVGVTFACMPVSVISDASEFINTVAGCVIIMCTTFIISAVGVKVGSVFGARYKNKAELLGGIVLILIGLKIIVEHLV